MPHPTPAKDVRRPTNLRRRRLPAPRLKKEKSRRKLVTALRTMKILLLSPRNPKRFLPRFLLSLNLYQVQKVRHQIYMDLHGLILKQGTELHAMVSIRRVQAFYADGHTRLSDSRRDRGASRKRSRSRSRSPSRRDRDHSDRWGRGYDSSASKRTPWCDGLDLRSCKNVAEL